MRAGTLSLPEALAGVLAEQAGEAMTELQDMQWRHTHILQGLPVRPINVFVIACRLSLAQSAIWHTRHLHATFPHTMHGTQDLQKLAVQDLSPAYLNSPCCTLRLDCKVEHSASPFVHARCLRRMMPPKQSGSWRKMLRSADCSTLCWQCKTWPTFQCACWPARNARDTACVAQMV